MDIENMHPFCLPFGFCHDATSSNTAADFTGSNNNNNNSLNSNNNDLIKDKIRSKTSSPSDELFRHLNNATSTSSAVTCQSLLNDHDLIIGSTSLQDITNDEHSFYSFGLDADIETDSTTNCENNDHHHLIDSDIDGCVGFTYNDNDLKITSNVDDWFCSSQFSLFSPTNNTNSSLDNFTSINSRRKSLIKSALLLNGGIHTSLSSSSSSGASSQNQVFQHIVDSIDIKSSPTLAQLNLNSNDDPADGFWDSPTTAAATTTTASFKSSVSKATSIATNSVDLLSSNTSINNNNNLHHHRHHHHTSPSPSLNETNNGLNCDLHHHHHHPHLQNHNHTHHDNHHHLIPSPTSSTSTYSSSAHLSSISSCHHIHHRHHHQQHQGRFSSPTAQSTCLAVTPFRRPIDLAHHQHQYHSSCCQNLLTTTNHLNGNLLNQNNNNNNNDSSGCNSKGGSNLKPSATLNQLNQQQHNQSSSSSSSSSVNSSVVLQSTSPSFRQLAIIDKSENQQNKSNQSHQQQPRSASPALVTSSSSPLSSSINQANGENRYIDNKLKENIEYLTALLCSGNKLDVSSGSNGCNNTNHQATISSTMARSYTNLAQSLSTGPKLLEKQQTQIVHYNGSGPQQKMLSQPNLRPVACNLTNEASPCTIEVNHQNFNQIQSQQHQQQETSQQQANPLKRPYPTDIWFKSPVESSVSAADSTESQVSSLTNSILDRSSSGTICATTQLVSCPHGLQLCDQPQAPLVDQRQKASELKVLSSFLNANKCPTSLPNNNVDCNAVTNNWQQNSGCINQAGVSKLFAQVSVVTTNLPIDQQQQQQQQLSKPSNSELSQSVPVNGKPITLKPVAQNNLLIQQQHRIRPSTNSLFAQPASPSASSTASSGGNNTETCLTVVLPPSNKRQRQIQSNSSTPVKTTNNTTSSRSNRPNSLSTDCSLSSHDEGFSSQIDNDDGNSTRAGDSDEDDDDDVDSDDESFYGDYTNSDLIGASISDNAENKWTLNMGRTRRNGQKRYFWQYNVQSKGPKGTRICSTDDSEDPFVLPEASDPVFSNDCQVEGVKHSGKARRGDGNDLTPNPRKLLMIGLELKKLGKIINDLAPVTNLPMNARNKTRKEKNKLASRACRLKKKAQHEANKIKLYGLQREHQQVVTAIYDIKKLLNETLLDRELKKELEQLKEIEDPFKSGDQEQEPLKTTLPADNNTAPTKTIAATTTSLETTATATAATTITTDSNNTNINSSVCNGINVSASVKMIAEQYSMKVAQKTASYVNFCLENFQNFQNFETFESPNSETK